MDGTDDDLFFLLERADAEELPGLYVGCGTEDFLHEDSVRFAEVARGRGIPVTVDLAWGDHDWDYWDRAIQHVLAWLPLPSTLNSVAR